MPSTYAELHCHTNFSFLDGASTAEDLVERAAQLGLPALAVTDHDGLYGVVRFALAAEAAGIRPILGVEIELLDAAVADPAGVVVPTRRAWRPGGARAREGSGGSGVATGASVAAGTGVATGASVAAGLPARPRPNRARLPGHRRIVKEDLRGIGERQRGPHLVLLARDGTGYRSLCRLISRANLNGTKRVPQFRQELLEANREGLVALSGCHDGEIARRLRVGDRAGAAAVARHYAGLFGGASRHGGESPRSSGFFLELSHHLLADDDWLVGELAGLADELGLPVVVTNDVHYARPEDRELGDVLTAIFHGRTLDSLGDLRRRDGESYLKSGEEMLALPPARAPLAAGARPADGAPRHGAPDDRTSRRWREGIATSAELAETCSVDLGFEQYRFPGFSVPKGETPFSYLSELCWEGARKRYHPMTPPVVNRLAHELEVIERAGLAEFFLICWDLMRFAREQRIPAQGRGSATSSIVSYTLGISRVEPIQHNLLFERFINEGRTTYPDVDIDFSSERREEVIQYVYRTYGPEHTGMVCNLVTYRARSAVREVGYALGFPRPLVDRVAKALETYDSVMVRRDLEADGGFAEFFRRPGDAPIEGLPEPPEPPEPPEAVAAATELTRARGLTDAMGQLNHARGGRFHADAATEHGDGRQPRREDVGRGVALGEAPGPGVTAPGRRATAPGRGASLGETAPGKAAMGEELIDGLGQLNKRMPLVGKVPPWRQPAKPVDPTAPRPFAWLAAADADSAAATIAADADAAAAAAAEQEPEPTLAPEPAVDPERSQTDMGGKLDQGSGSESRSTMRPASGFIPPRAWDGTKSGTGLPAPASDGLHSASKLPRVSVWDNQAAIRPGPSVSGSSASGMWEEAPQSPPSIRPGRSGDDEGGPGDTPASVAWLRAGRGTGYGRDADRHGAGRPGAGRHGPGHVQGPRVLESAQGTVNRRAIDPESGALAPPARRTDATGRATDRLGRPNHWDPPAPAWNAMGRGGTRASDGTDASGGTPASGGTG
ncbi:MAG TPA: PHP domain-containing protein, partial [Candidatus Limnocylindrales bacterium]